jgi:predicted methyltransferase
MPTHSTPYDRETLIHLVEIAIGVLELIASNPYYQNLSKDFTPDVTLGDSLQFLGYLEQELESQS